MFVLGIVIFLGAIFGLIPMWFGSHTIFALIDSPTALFHIALMLSVIVATRSFKIFIVATNAVLSKKYHISGADKEKAIRLFKLLGKTSLAAAIISTIMGLFFMLFNMDNPSTIGPHIAISMLAMIYGISFNLIFIYPAIYVLESRQTVEEKRVISEKEVIDKLFELCYKQGISAEEILEAQEISFRKYQ